VSPLQQSELVERTFAGEVPMDKLGATEHLPTLPAG
jgi:hypothetical protein